MLLSTKECIGTFLFVLSIHTIFSSKCHGYVLNPPRVLLPYNYGLPSNYTLVIEGTTPQDCFEWKTTHNGLLIVEPIFEDLSTRCSRRAVVSVLSAERERNVARITAVHKSKPDVALKGEVITDFPAKIELSWITDSLNVGGLPEVVSIKAKDQFGHSFSSIDGLQFNWKIRSTESETDDKVIRLRPLSGYNRLQPNGWELRGLLGDSVLVEALRAGICSLSATTSIRISQRTILSTPEIEIKVAPNVRLTPSKAIRLIRGGSVNINLETAREGEQLKNKEDYHVVVKDSTIAEIAEDSNMIIAKEYGETYITYASSNNMFEEIKVNLEVVKPARMEIYLSKGNYKMLQEMKSYVVTVELYDENDNLIYPSDNLRIDLKVPKSFYVNSTTSNGTWHVLQTLTPGKGKIKAEYKGVVSSDGTVSKGNKLSATYEVVVCQKLQIFPPYVLLPSDSSTNPLHIIRLMVTGGTGEYLWASNNDSVATVVVEKEKGHEAQLQIFKESDFTVTISDQGNLNFLTTSKISVQPVIDIETYPTVVEAEVGNILILPVALLAYENKERKIIRKFDDCSTIQPTVDIIDKHVLEYDQEPHIPAFGKGCLSLQFRCKLPGYSRINVSYKSNRHTSEAKIHKTTTVLSCFKTLKPVHPVRVAVLPLGASKEVAFEGGPRKWPLFKTGHYTTLEADNPSLFNIEFVNDPIRYNKDLTVFKVLCKALGESSLTFHIGNQPSATNPHPAKSETSIKIICSEPSSLHLKLYRKNTKREPLDENIVKVAFYGHKMFAVDVWLKDSTGRKLSNISSLSLKWDITDTSLAEPESYSGFTTHDNAVAGYRKVTRDFKEFKMTGETGKVQVTAKVKGYRHEALLEAGIHSNVVLKEISGSIDLNLVSLRDINAGLYSSNTADTQEDEDNTCDSDSCKS